MARKRKVNLIGSPPGILFPEPVVAERAPNSGDKNYDIGQLWVDKILFDVYTLAGFSGGVPQWINAGGGGGSFSSLVVNPGPTTLTGALTVTAGTENISIGADAADHDIALGSATGVSLLTVQWGTSGATLAGAASGALILGAAAQTADMTFGRSTAANILNIGTGVNTGAQVVNVSTGAAAADSTINMLSGIATVGTQTLNLFTGASTSTGQAVNIMNGAGSGTRVFTLAGSGALATTIGIGDGVLGNSITLGNGNNSVAQTVSIASGLSAADSTVSILSGASTAGTQTLNLLNAASAGTAQTFNLMSAAGVGSATATCNIANGGTVANVNIANGVSGNTVIMMGGINTSAQIMTLANGATAADSTVNILSGVGTAGAGVLNMANNPRVTTVDIGDVAPAAARTFTIAGGDQAQDDTVNILAGAPSAGTQTFNLLSGTATGGTAAVNIATGGGAAKAVSIGTTAASSTIQLFAPATAGVKISNGTQNLGIYVGTGSPNGSLTAAQGSLYLNAGGSGVADRAFINTDGAMAWTAISTVA